MSHGTGHGGNPVNMTKRKKVKRKHAVKALRSGRYGKT